MASRIGQFPLKCAMAYVKSFYGVRSSSSLLGRSIVLGRKSYGKSLNLNHKYFHASAAVEGNNIHLSCT
jgi:hypothetical protein